MSRTTISVPLRTKRIDDVLGVLSLYLTSEGYAEKILDGEEVWAKGDGVILPLSCLKATFTGNEVLLQGWIRDAILGESALEGFAGGFHKKKLKNLMQRIQHEIQNKEL